MKLKQLIKTYAQTFTDRYGQRLLPGHRKALDAMLACRSHCGEFIAQCATCPQYTILPLSCGHRSCPQCQHHLSDAWQQRQQQKLLPVNYFMVTFTLPHELRSTAWRYQSQVYDLLFKAGVEALQTVGRNNHKLSLGMTGVLHTHKRDKGYHPHVHIMLPGGGVSGKGQNQRWKSFPQNFIINEFALATIFRGIFLRMLFEQALPLPSGLPKQWVAHIRKVGRGQKALRYLSRYLYRGVISENDILADNQGQVTFRYQESNTRKLVTKKQDAEDFLWCLLKHVLPRGFRRVRDSGFLHGNASKALRKIQQLLGVNINHESQTKKGMACPQCLKPLSITRVLPKRIPMQFRFYPTVDKTVLSVAPG